MGAPALRVERWKAAVDGGQFGVWDLNPRLELVHYASAWKQRFGFPNILAPDHTSFWRCRVHPDDLGPMMLALQAHLDGRSATYEASFRLRSNGSGYRCVVSRGRVVARDYRGDATRMVGTMIDVTERPFSPRGCPSGSEPGHFPQAAEASMPLMLAAAGSAPLPALIARVSDLLHLACEETDSAPDGGKGG